MSFLSDELNRQIQSQGTNALQLAEKCKISSAQIYKWANSAQTSISGEQLDALATALSNDPMEHARLLVAHLQDERLGSAKDLVRIEFEGPMMLQDKPIKLSKGERAIKFLAEERRTSRDVDALVIDLAKVLGAKL